MKAKSDQVARWRVRMRAAGICVSCGKNEATGAHCVQCRGKNKARRDAAKKVTTPKTKRVRMTAADKFRQLVADGTCVKCRRARAVKPHTMCDDCRAYCRTASRNTFRRARTAMLSAYGGKCACCGEAEPNFLTFDHINNDGATHRKTLKKRAGSAFVKYLRDHRPDDIQVLCYNCNCAKGHYGICPHERDRLGEIPGARVVTRRRTTTTP